MHGLCNRSSKMMMGTMRVILVIEALISLKAAKGIIIRSVSSAKQAMKLTIPIFSPNDSMV